MSEETTVIYKGAWEEAYLCASCGEYLSSNITATHWGKPCPRCGQVGTLCPSAVKTPRRFVCTKKRRFKADLGYYEWSGLTDSGESIVETPFMDGRILAAPVTTTAKRIRPWEP